MLLQASPKARSRANPIEVMAFAWTLIPGDVRKPLVNTSNQSKILHLKNYKGLKIYLRIPNRTENEKRSTQWIEGPRI